MSLIFVPGFTQTARSWAPVLDRLAPRTDLVALDVPSTLGFAETAAALGGAGGPGDYVGYSMGGRLCLRLALDRPDLVRRLVLLSATPGIDAPAERAARLDADERLASSIEHEGADAFLRRWVAQPMFASLPAAAAGLAERRRGHTVGTLTHALRRLGQGAQEPLWGRLAELEIPVTIMAGELDHKYVAIGRRMAHAIGPSARLAVIDGAGHAAHLERPDEFVHVLTS
jgi:2-succinyl-6-hydroxy-2,4-cyclohexadiene-1-carboxylate synthase